METNRDDFIIAIRSAFLKKGAKQRFSLIVLLFVSVTILFLGKYNFKGIKPGDSWCLCATWYARALEENVACSIYLKKTNIKTLELIPIEKLKKYALDIS